MLPKLSEVIQLLLLLRRGLNGGDDISTDCDNQSFFNKFRQIHEENKNWTFTKRVNHINETFNTINNAKINLNKLFGSDGRDKLELLEFLTEQDLNLSHDCISGITRIIIGILKSDLWAIKFIDSMGRWPPPGFAEGMQSSFGEFDECLSIESPKTDSNKQIIKGQYCLMKAILPFPPVNSYTEGEPLVEGSDISTRTGSNFGLERLTTLKAFIEGLNLANGTIFRIGTCLPSVCSPQEIETVLNQILSPVIRIGLEFEPKCQIKDEYKPLDNFQILSLTILTILIILVILSTAYEIFSNQNKHKLPEKLDKYENVKDLWESFSIIKNTNSLFVENTKFAALDTIRMLIIVNVHVAHLYQYTTSNGIYTLKKIFSQVMPSIYEDNKYFFARAPLIIDALFTLSGFLVSFTLLRKLNKTRGRFNYVDFIFQRWIRFMFLMSASVIFFYLFPLTGDGPVWEMGIDWVTPGCKDPSVLFMMFMFITNFRSDEHREQHEIAVSKCNPTTWFLATLLQFMTIAPFLILLYFKKPIIGLYTIAALIVFSLFLSISPYILFGIRPYLQIWELETVVITNSKSFKWYHWTPNVFAVSFFVGVLFGYFMNRKISLSRLHVWFLWIFSFVSIVSAYLWNNSFWDLHNSAPLYSVLLWHSVGKLFFSMGFGWIYFACCTGRGGILNKCLSWTGFQPLARLSFGIYLLHYMVVIHRVFTVKNIYLPSAKLMTEHLIFDLIIDVILAYIFYILFECPFTNILGYYSRNRSKYIKHNNIYDKI